jgi:hypothetical protein
MPDGRVEFEITADGRKAYASIDQITEELRKAGIKWEKDAKTSTDSIGTSFEGTMKKIVSAISAAGIGKMLLSIGKDALQAASDLEEVQNVVDVTFGSAGAKKIEAWAKAAGDQFGLTETQAKRFTSTLGAMMKSSGLAGDEIVDMSTDMAGLAADMASFYNLDFDTAFQKIRSGISGETEPLKQLGINMSVANLEAFALQKGLDKTFSEMTQGEQVMLRYQYLMSATADAQGDFSRTMDGFANSKRLFETNLETLKTNLGGFIMDVVTPAIAGINEFFAALTKEPERTVIDDFNDIEVDTAAKMAKLDETYNKASDIVSLLDEISKTTVTLNSGEVMTLEDLFGNMANVEKNGGDVQGYLRGLGVDVDFVNQKYQVWKGYTKELTDLIPELSESIDGETGAIDGGTEALQRNLDEWRKTQEKKIVWAEYYAKEQALAEKKGSMYAYEMEAGGARQALERQRQLLEQMGKRAYIPEDDTYGMIVHSGMFDQYTEEEKAWNEAVKKYNELRDKMKAADAEYERQTVDYSEAEQKLADEKTYLIEKYGEEADAINETADATGNLTEEQQKMAEEAEQAFIEAHDAVLAYREEVRKATEQSVNSNIGGFREIKLAAQVAAEAAGDYKTYAEALGEAALSEEEWQSTIKDKNDQITTQGMTKALESQLAFIEEYKKNLEDVKSTGLIDDDILASLSDGSEESAQYLHAMAEAARAGDTKGLAELNEAWKAVNEGKESFVDELTKQKLAVDTQYDAMVAKAQEAAKALDVSETAGESTGKNIQAMATAVTEYTPLVAAAVDGVLAELNRLNEWGVTIDYGFGASTVIKPGARGNTGGMQIASLAVGADWIPFDGYLAQLHQGEAVLTAEENRVWQAFKNGQRGVDYDQIGGMISGIKPGGDVYLEGRVVGQVVSQIQGNQYRTMQRSGWQG